MSQNVTQKLIEAHLVSGRMHSGDEIGLTIDQTLTQDATGTLVMLELEAMGLNRVKTEVSAQYVDHNLIQQDFKNPDDHIFLQSACRRFGLWFSRPGNGVSHPIHMSRFGIPGKSLLGSDSHTCGAGAAGMLAIGAGGLEVAAAMAGQPYYVAMPQVWGIRLKGSMPNWVSAKDVILEMLRRFGVRAGRGRVIEYCGDGAAELTVWDRHVIANMGAELGATTTVFASDKHTRDFLTAEGRSDDWEGILPDDGCSYDIEDEIDLESLVPLIAKPSSPGNVVPVTEVAGEEIYQSYIGSSANPGYRDFAVPALMVKDRKIDDRVSFDINPSSRAMLQDLVEEGLLGDLLGAGARIHQPGCNGCIGMGQAPATGKNSLRTVPRNFPGRSGTKEDSVWLCSPETATASALNGRITDPREMKMDYPRVSRPASLTSIESLLSAPPPLAISSETEVQKGPNIHSIPEISPFPNRLELPVLLKVGDDISTDEIMPAGSRVLPFRSNIPKISDFCFDAVDPEYSKRALSRKSHGEHAIVGGFNYGQGSSREHAALAPRYLGLRIVIARSIARIHWQNLIGFGILPVTFVDPGDYDEIEADDILSLEKAHETIESVREFELTLNGHGSLAVKHDLSPRQVGILLAGGLINMLRPT
jgi:aconitate hydratase